ncbi:MAG: winged helix-turn-helix transcriptional regulator [Candidatus Riflebacteria bacterium]|nr:winged helix-turn-helix transcriptional regulator [Candidatus Riflebacteria bacterium]
MARRACDALRELLTIAKALSDSNRVRVLISLHDGELCVCQVVELLGLAPSTVSKHLAVLQQAGLTEARKEGRWMYYRLAGRDAPRCVRDAIRWIRSNLENDPRIVQDRRKLDAILGMSLSDLCRRYRA